MSFFHTLFRSIQPRHDRSYSASVSTINDEIDEETAALIANLALDNLTDLMGSRGDFLPTDEAMAYLLQSEQFDQWLSIMADAKFAKSIDDSSLVSNAAYLDAFITAEEAAVEDRIAAELLSRGEALPVPKSCQRRLEDPNFIMNPEFITEPWMEDESMDGEQIESDSDRTRMLFSTAKHSNAAGKRSTSGPSANHDKRVYCVSCHEYCRYLETFKTPCDHYYCRNCLVALVEAFTRDESLFPLRCCLDPIPVAGVLPNLSSGLRSLFQQKNTEFSVLARDRLYCSNPRCCTFLGSSEGRLFVSTIKCPQCRVKTCLRCKELAHRGEGCGVGALQALAMNKDWQKCPGCNTVVELNEGCNHITCRCRTQFCYLCAAPWKTCNCPQ